MWMLKIGPQLTFKEGSRAPQKELGHQMISALLFFFLTLFVYCLSIQWANRRILPVFKILSVLGVIKLGDSHCPFGGW